MDEEFDLGPLTWVKGELDTALATARAGLAGWDGQETGPLQAAAAHLHQVYGALQIVDLQGVSMLTSEVERLLHEMTSKAPLRTRAAADLAMRAIDSLKEYLDELMAGGRNTETRLTPLFQQLVTARGGVPPAPSELFFPDTTLRVPRSVAETPMEDTARARAIRTARSRYQRGLLQYLQGKDPQSGLLAMDQAVKEVERLAPGPAQYSFWWSAAALIEGLRRSSGKADFWQKRLCGRIDLQMRRLMEGSRQLAERLFRDVLYYVAQDATPGGRAAEARDLYQLERLAPQASGGAKSAHTAQITGLKDQLKAAKDHWLRCCSGQHDSLAAFQHATLDAFEASTHLPNPALQSLTRMIQAVAKRLNNAAEATRNEVLQLEMATAILLLQNAADHFESLGDEFKRQSEALSMRLQAAIDPSFDASRIPQVDLLDDISRAAQEKLLLAQVTREIQNNLNQVEEILDKFFRNSAHRDGLPKVPGLMKQILGALNILQLDVARDLLNECSRRIGHFSEGDAYITTENLNWVAEALSTLGLYVEALRFGRDDSQALAGLMAVPEASPGQEQTVEAQIREETAHIRESLQTIAHADKVDEAGKAAVKAELSQLARDAELVGDAKLRGQADAALTALESAAPAAALQAIEAIAPAPVAPSIETQRLAASSTEVIDQELLGIYIEEANEVLGTIAIQVSRLQISAYDNDAFTTVRRGFHTLKGSGRMVGLTDLGEAAWEVEQTLNQWLRDERAPTPDMLNFLESAGNAFQGWVSQLESRGRAQVDAELLTAGARRLRGETGVSPQEAAPPKDEAGASAEAPAEPSPILLPSESFESSEFSESSEPPAPADDRVDIEGHILPATLFDIFTSEAGQRLIDLRNALDEMAGPFPGESWERFNRAAHTLAGISRTTGFTPLAEVAHAMENWSGAWPDTGAALAQEAVQAVERGLTALAEGVEDVLAHRFPIHPCDAFIPPPAPTPAETNAFTLEEAQSDDLAGLELSEADAEDVFEALFPDAPPSPSPALELAEAAPAPVEPPRFPHDETVDEPVAPVMQATRATPAAKPQVQDDLDPELLPIFLEETEDLLPKVGGGLRAWRAQAPGASEDLKRVLHTLKGSARMAGAMNLGEAVHLMESHVVAMGDGAQAERQLDYLEAQYDGLAEAIDRLKRGESSAIPVLPAPEDMQEADALLPAVAAEPTEIPAAQAQEEPQRMRQSLRVDSEVMDTLLNEAGEVAIARSRIENVLTGYKQTAQELAANVDRLRSQLRELDIQAESQMRSRFSHMDDSHFDPLEFDRFSRLQELTRQLAESVDDVSTAQNNLLSGLTEADNALLVQGRMARTLQQELMHIRMLPLNTLEERLHRILRQSARETGKRVQLELEGGHTEMDRGVLDKITAPLEHLLRNAVAHGLETPEARAAQGKPEQGLVRLTARQEGSEIVLELSDDGAGIQLDAVRRKALDAGWISPDQEVSNEALEQLLFRSGFSTARQVTELAGRGVGLDVVKNEIAGIGGRVRLDNQPGQGAKFTIRLPLTLALSQVVMARAGDQLWALPANLVALVREVRVEQFHALQESGFVELGGERYPLRSLAELLGRTSIPAEGRHRTILLLRAGDQRLAVRVDGLEGNFEAVLKPIGPQLARIAGVSGATVLADGRVALIINPFYLAERMVEVGAPAEQPEEQESALVMVVDDSLTVRKIATRFLQREGYRVTTARDGQEAMEMLEEEVPDIMLLDIEMPRMDGFEVAHHVRASSRTRGLPIIMITSRTADKHRDHALSLGVNAYMGKPYVEEELLTEIRRLTHAEAVAEAAL
ncbi:MAG: Hpt domain-containing protein [Betaproteobacteria bacterium]|nr:Hpt domain-containing protein [Betaproteobacteria bacterium]